MKVLTLFFSHRGILIGEQTGTFQIKVGNISTASIWKAGRKQRIRKNCLLVVLVLFGRNTLMLLRGKTLTRKFKF